MMNFINPHAILLTKENAWAIYRTTGMDLNVVNDILSEPSPEPQYVVGWRDENTGLPRNEILTQAELKEKYHLTDLPTYMDTGFRKL